MNRQAIDALDRSGRPFPGPCGEPFNQNAVGDARFQGTEN
jgi:hypothetical protein